LVVASCTSTQEVEAEDLPEPREQGGALGVGINHFGVDTNLLRIESFDQSVDAFPRLRVILRSENLTDQVMRNPAVELWCDESEDGGEWFLGSTWEAHALLPPAEVSEGEIIVGFPHKPESERYPVASCSNARVKVIGENTADRQQSVAVYAVEPEVIDEAIDAPRGRQLPLPPR
jgi:hypothetical protein